MLVPLSVAPQLIRLDVPLMIAASVGVWLAAWNGVITVWEASLMVICFVLYNAWLISQGSNDDTEVLEALHLPRSSNWRLITWNCLLALLGLGLLVVGARLLVDSATTIARTLGVSDIVIGLTIVAGGTSLPELATSLVAAIKGQRDIAVGNVVGSNIFNLLAVLSTASILSAEGLTVAPDVLWFDLTVMTLIAILCWPIFVSHLTISRGEGLVLLLLFFTYNSLLIADAIYKEKISHLNPVFTLGVLPLILLLSALHLWRSKQTGSPELSSD
jgi:cation:H+ antiporter